MMNMRSMSILSGTTFQELGGYQYIQIKPKEAQRHQPCEPHPNPNANFKSEKQNWSTDEFR